MEQLNRAKRYLKRIEKLYAGVFSSMGHDEEEYFDDILSFFIHCYHVRDLAFHQDGAVVRAREIDALIELNEPLRICADLANGSKHCKLMRTPRSGHQPTISQPQKLSCTWFVGDCGGEILQCSYLVESNGKLFDVRVLACECITLWEKFLNGPRPMD